MPIATLSLKYTARGFFGLISACWKLVFENTSTCESTLMPSRCSKLDRYPSPPYSSDALPSARRRPSFAIASLLMVLSLVAPESPDRVALTATASASATLATMPMMLVLPVLRRLCLRKSTDDPEEQEVCAARTRAHVECTRFGKRVPRLTVGTGLVRARTTRP